MGDERNDEARARRAVSLYANLILRLIACRIFDIISRSYFEGARRRSVRSGEEENLDYQLYPNTSHIHPHMCG